MKVFKFYFGISLIGIYMGFFNGCLATLRSARCRSRCFAQDTTTSDEFCRSQSCLACLKPCNVREAHVLSCSLICGLYNISNVTKGICEDSCKFLQEIHLEEGNSTCPEGVSNYSKCVLMKPENVQVAAPVKNKRLENYTISWNGTWPSSTVFVVMVKQWKKGKSTDANTVWIELMQTTLQSVQVNLQPLVWYQFKVTASNQYGASLFSLPSRLMFARPRPPLPPRAFNVTEMQVVKGRVQVHVVWKKPVSSFGLPVSKYRISWSMRLDNKRKKYMPLEVTDHHTMGNNTEYTINELLPNTMYLLELRAMTRWKRRNLKSKRVTIRIRTPSDNTAKVHVQNKSPIKKEFRNVFKKTSTPRVDLTTYSSSPPTDVLTSSNEGVSGAVKRKRSIAQANTVPWFALSTLMILAYVVPFGLR
ncbi:unnamed protein product [Porites lobata]|uniref:Fibronectin type-III domain-containing protein n=1 Tax=Porites lobata TaxID=104759 RepID=A0ABN8NV97_9CNID|nr:unnamed protein product [Porites lobata]